MQPDHARLFTRRAVAKMALHRIAHHRPQFVQCVALRDDGMAERRGNVASVNLVVCDFKNDLTL